MGHKTTRWTYPYFLFIASAAAGDRKPQVHAAAAIPARERSVLGLRVHAHGCSAHTETLSDTRVHVECSMRALDGLEEGEVVQ